MLVWSRIERLANELRGAAKGARAAESWGDEDELQQYLDQISNIWRELDRELDLD